MTNLSAELSAFGASNNDRQSARGGKRLQCFYGEFFGINRKFTPI
jgi:hypothetical protein